MIINSYNENLFISFKEGFCPMEEVNNEMIFSSNYKVIGRYLREVVSYNEFLEVLKFNFCNPYSSEFYVYTDSYKDYVFECDLLNENLPMDYYKILFMSIQKNNLKLNDRPGIYLLEERIYLSAKDLSWIVYADRFNDETLIAVKNNTSMIDKIAMPAGTTLPSLPNC